MIASATAAMMSRRIDRNRSAISSRYGCPESLLNSPATKRYPQSQATADGGFSTCNAGRSYGLQFSSKPSWSSLQTVPQQSTRLRGKNCERIKRIGILCKHNICTLVVPEIEDFIWFDSNHCGFRSANSETPHDTLKWPMKLTHFTRLSWQIGFVPSTEFVTFQRSLREVMGNSPEIGFVPVHGLRREIGFVPSTEFAIFQRSPQEAIGNSPEIGFVPLAKDKTGL
jgi:hypothetical protein